MRLINHNQFYLLNLVVEWHYLYILCIKHQAECLFWGFVILRGFWNFMKIPPTIKTNVLLLLINSVRWVRTDTSLNICKLSLILKFCFVFFPLLHLLLISLFLLCSHFPFHSHSLKNLEDFSPFFFCYRRYWN